MNSCSFMSISNYPRFFSPCKVLGMPEFWGWLGSGRRCARVDVAQRTHKPNAIIRFADLFILNPLASELNISSLIRPGTFPGAGVRTCRFRSCHAERSEASRPKTDYSHARFFASLRSAQNDIGHSNRLGPCHRYYDTTIRPWTQAKKPVGRERAAVGDGLRFVPATCHLDRRPKAGVERSGCEPEMHPVRRQMSRLRCAPLDTTQCVGESFADAA